MTRSAHHMERLQQALAEGAERARRLSFMLANPWDEVGRPTITMLPKARRLVEHSLREASDAAADIGCEIGDVRWTGFVAILHSASTAIASAQASECEAAAHLLDALRDKATRLRNLRAGRGPVVRLS